MSDKVTTSDVRRLLRERHDPNAWAYFEEVPNGTGSQKSRSADAIAMSLWPSRGLELHGYEIKVSRQDWLKELKTPEKGEAFFKFCHRWWLVVGDVNIVKEGELPATWGLKAVKNGKLYTIKEAPLNEHVQPMTYPILAGLLRVLSQTTTSNTAIADRIHDSYQQGLEQGKKSVKWEGETAQRRVKELEAAIKSFEERSGVSITSWNGGMVGDAVKLVLETGPQNIKNTLTGIKRQLQGITKNIERVLEEDVEKAS